MSPTSEQFKALARVLRAAADEAEAIAEEARAEHRDWIDQRRSALGPRRHVAAVRRRVAAGTSDAAMVGRNALLSPAALADELARVSTGTAKAKPAAAAAAGPEAMRARLGLVVGGGGR